MSILTGFKSTDIDSYSKVEPTTTTKFGYKRLGLDTNAMTGLYELASTTTETGTTDQVAIMSGVVGTVREGDVLEYSGMRSEITSVSGSSFTLGRKISTLTSGLAVTIYRPTYLSTTSTGALNAVSSATASSLVIETVTGTLGALNAEVVVDNPRFCKVELWGTANLTVIFYQRMDTPTGTAEKGITGTIVDTTGAVSGAPTSALGFNATNGEAWAHFSPVAAQRFIVRASGYTSGTLNVRITNMNWPVDGNEFGSLYKIWQLIGNVQVDDGTGWLGNLCAGYDQDAFAPILLRMLQSNPTGSESGLIVRNIPSGVQAASQSGTWNVRLHDPVGSALPKVDGVSSSGAYGVPAMVWDPDSVAWTPLIGSGTGLYVVQQGAISVTDLLVSTTATLSNVSASASSVTLLASNTARKKAHFYNDSSYPCYLKHGSSASTTSFTVLMQPQSYYTIEPPCYSGLVAGIWGTASGTMRVTEETA